MNTPTAVAAQSLVEMIDLSGKTAIVTGGAMGIGQGIAARLHEAGASVVIADVDDRQASSLADTFNRQSHDSALATHADVSSPQDVQSLFTTTMDTFGGVDVLVNNAGIYPLHSFTDMDQDLFEKVLRVNLVGPFLTMKAAARQMIAQGRGGKIINISSIDAVHPSSIGLAHYDASKHGLWGLTKNVALELSQHGIAVNAIAPGAISTPGTSGVSDPELVRQSEQRIPMHRMGDPDEIGRVALFLASDLASYVLGSQIVVDGGMLLR